MIRNIVKIDQDKCDGCGLCVPSCAEGAIQIIDGKALLLADNLCDGLGACLGDCPRDAITIEQRDSAEFDEAAVEEHLKSAAAPLVKAQGHGHGHHAHGGGCPSAQVKSFAAPAAGGGCPSARVMNFAQPEAAEAAAASQPSQLRQWPVLLHLVPPSAPFLKDADLLLAADCAAYAYADFHEQLLKGRTLLVGCPKFDDAAAYAEKLAAILRQNDIRSLTVARMEVPCCSGLTQIAKVALEKSGKDIPLVEAILGVQGERKK